MSSSKGNGGRDETVRIGTVSGGDDTGIAATSEPSSGNETGDTVVPLSPSLRRLIAEADERLFPHAEELKLGLSSADASALQLVPDELLDAFTFEESLSPSVDPLEFTFLGTASSTPEAPDPATSHHTEAMMKDSSAASGATAVEERPEPKVQRGTFDRSTLAKLAWSLDTRRGQSLLVVARPDGPDLQLTVDNGQIVGAPPAPGNDEHPGGTRNGEPGPKERLVQSRRAARDTADLVGQLLGTKGKYTLTEVTSVERLGPRLALLHTVIEQMRGLTRPAHVRDAIIEDGGSAECAVRTNLSRADERRLSLAGIESELMSVLSESPVPLTALLTDMPAEYGTPGVIHFLMGIGALVTLPLPPSAPGLGTSRSHPASKHELLQAQRRAQRGTYFEILQVPTDASPRQIALAIEAKRRELALGQAAATDPNSHDHNRLLGARREVADSIREAEVVLLNPRFRAHYLRGMATHHGG